jgi:hypothetical protein
MHTTIASRARRTFSLVMSVSTVTAGMVPAQTVTSAPTAEERSLIASLLQVMHSRDTARLAPLLDPAFRIGPMQGASAREMMAKLLATRTTPTTGLTIDSVTRSDSTSVLHTTILGAERPRQAAFTLAKSGLIVETGLLTFSTTGPPPSPGSGATGPLRMGTSDGTALQSSAGMTPVPVARDTALRRRLVAMQERDQRHRARLVDLLRNTARTPAEANELDSLRAIQNRFDAENVDTLVSILKTEGWPTFDKAGFDGNIAAFLVLQHAPPAVQREYLPLLETAARAGQSRLSDMAMLVDRVLMGQGKKQKYGSQVHMASGQPPSVWPIEDEPNVETRRRDVGLEPLRDYLKRLGIEYRPGGDSPTGT